LAAGIVGVPSLMAIGAGYFIAQNVIRNQKVLEQYNLSELQMLNNIGTDQHRNSEVIIKFLHDDLRAQYQTCITASRNDEQRKACISPMEREQEYGMPAKKKRPKE
jgi:predicted small secreted protein